MKYSVESMAETRWRPCEGRVENISSLTDSTSKNLVFRDSLEFDVDRSTSQWMRSKQRKLQRYEDGAELTVRSRRDRGEIAVVRGLRGRYQFRPMACYRV